MVSNPFSSGISVNVSSDTSSFESGINGAIQTLGNFRTQIGLAGVAIAGLSTFGLAKGVSAFADFDAAMTESQAIMGDLTDEEMANMEQAARDVATTTQFSAEQAAESYFFLASAGLDATESIEALDDTARFAQAGQFDMAQATDVLTDSASALGLEVAEYNDLADIMVRTNQLANTSVEQLGNAFTNKAAAQLRNLNKTAEEGAAALAAFADQGIKGNRAGQRLNILLRDLPDAASENTEAFEDLGVQVFDAEGNMRNIADIIGDVEDATEGMSTEQQQAALSSLGLNKRVSDSLVALTGTSDAIREYQSELEGAGGATEEVAGNQMDTFNAQMGITKSLITDIFIGIGENLVPALSSLNEGLQNAIESFSRVNDRTGGILATVTLITGAVGGLVVAIGAFLPTLLGVGAGIKTVAGALLTLSGPIALVVGSVALLALAWKNNWGDIQGKTETVVAFIQDLIDTSLTRITAFWDEHGDEIIATATSAFETVRDTIDDVLTFVWTGLIKPILESIQELWDLHGDEILAEATETWEAIRDKIEPVLRFIWEDVVKPILTAIQEFWDEHGDTILAGVEDVFDSIEFVIETAMDAFLTAIKVGLNLIQADWDEAWDEIKGFASRTLDRIEELIKGWNLTEFFADKLDAAKQKFEDFKRDIVGNSILPDMLGDVEAEIRGSDIDTEFLEKMGRMQQAAENTRRAVGAAMEDTGVEIRGAPTDTLESLAEAQKAVRESTERTGKAVKEAMPEPRGIDPFEFLVRNHPETLGLSGNAGGGGGNTTVNADITVHARDGTDAGQQIVRDLRGAGFR